MKLQTFGFKRMREKAAAKPKFATALFIVLCCAVFTIFLPHLSNPFGSSPPDSPPSLGPKIYVYDLPRRFTSGIVKSYYAARGIPSNATADYPGHQYSAEWWLFSDLMRADRPNSPVRRVFDPEEADLFFVSFFSSLSVAANLVRRRAGGRDYSDANMQEEVVEWLERQVYWRRNSGRDHVIVCQDPNALHRVIDRVRNAVLLVSDFGRLKGNQASLLKDVILPYSHRISSYDGEIGVEKRNTLLFFMGNRFRKEGGKIRDKLFKILENENDVTIKHGLQSRESRRMATWGMHSSKFCLHPAGDTPSACRLFDAIVSLCVPVIVSDHIELPFEDVIDYKKIAIFVDSNIAVKPGYLTSLLRGTSTKRILRYQRELNAVKQYFEYDNLNGMAKEIWRQVSLKLPSIKLMINRDKRLVQREMPGLDCSCICTTTNIHPKIVTTRALNHTDYH